MTNVHWASAYDRRSSSSSPWRRWQGVESPSKSISRLILLNICARSQYCGRCDFYFILKERGYDRNVIAGRMGSLQAMRAIITAIDEIKSIAIKSTIDRGRTFLKQKQWVVLYYHAYVLHAWWWQMRLKGCIIACINKAVSSCGSCRRS